MAKNTVQSVEPNIADLVNGWPNHIKWIINWSRSP